MNTKRTLLGVIVLSAVGAVGVGAMGGVDWLDSIGVFGEERQLRVELNGYWQARVRSDMAGMARHTHPDDSVSDPGMMVTEKYEIETVEIDGDTATAQVRVWSRLRHPMLSSRVREVGVRQPWTRHDGRWVIVHSEDPLDSISRRSAAGVQVQVN